MFLPLVVLAPVLNRIPLEDLEFLGGIERWLWRVIPQSQCLKELGEEAFHGLSLPLAQPCASPSRGARKSPGVRRRGSVSHDVSQV